jgi:hypothetical protein
MPENLVDANKTCVRRQFEELWNNGHLNRIDDFFAKDFMNFGQQYQDGRALVKHIVTIWRTAFPDLRFTVDSMVAEGDSVMCEASFQGTDLGELQLIRPLQGPSLPPKRQDIHGQANAPLSPKRGENRGAFCRAGRSGHVPATRPPRCAWKPPVVRLGHCRLSG